MNEAIVERKSLNESEVFGDKDINKRKDSSEDESNIVMIL